MRCLRLVAAAIFLPLPAFAACHGHDLFPKLKTERPEAFAAIEAAGRTMPYGHGRFFKVSRAGQAPSYVLGTLHLSDPRITDISTQVSDALREASALIVELKDEGKRQISDPNTRAEARGVLLARPDQRPDRLLSKHDFLKLQKEVESRQLKLSAETLKPAFLALWLDTPPCALDPSHRILDFLLTETARAHGTPVIAVETVAEQVQGLDKLSTADESQLLRSTLAQSRHAEDMVETTVQRYLQSDLGGLVAWMRSPDIIAGTSASRTPPAFLDLLLDARNERMLPTIAPYLEKGGAFIAIGAAHLPGSHGLLELIAQKGYQIELIE